MRICEFGKFPENKPGSQEILHCIFYRDPGIPGPRDEIRTRAEFAKKGGPKSEMVYSIATREKLMNDYMNQ